MKAAPPAAFRACDSRWPWLWDSDQQPARRWHGEGEGPVHYFATSPQGAWAEIMRHEEIVDAADLEGLDLDLWMASVPRPEHTPELDFEILVGGHGSYPACRDEARRLRQELGARGLVAPSAALLPGGAEFHTLDEHGHASIGADSEVIVVFGHPDRDEVVGVLCTRGGGPDAQLLDFVRYMAPIE